MKKILIIGSQGYVGSNLVKYLDSENYDLTLVDNQLRKSNVGNSFIKTSYQDLDETFLNHFEECVWLAGHSSVGMANEDPEYALHNNFIDLINFYKKFNGRFIYASTGSVYSRDDNSLSDEESNLSTPKNMYDYSKVSFDNYLVASNLPAITLRFGTVNGFGTNIKSELMINSMVKAFKEKNVLNVNNGNFYRPILWLYDLIPAIKTILDSNVNDGVFNLCSFNSKIEDIAIGTAEILGSKINKLDDTPTYNFQMKNDKFRETFNCEFKGNLEIIVNQLLENKY